VSSNAGSIQAIPNEKLASCLGGEHGANADTEFPAGRRGGIKALLMQKQVNALGMKFAEEAEQIDERSAKAIDRPSREYVHISPCLASGLFASAENRYHQRQLRENSWE
jgi:hypothetical protein